MDPAQEKQIKEQLIQQISSTFPEDKKGEAIKKIEAMDSSELRAFLIENNLIKSEGELKSPSEGSPSKCIFCSIISGEIPTNKLDENKKAIAALEINPISKGHSIIIPKEHIESSGKLSSQTFSLAKKLAKRIKSKLKPKEVTIISSNVFGHELVNILPIYEKENLGSPRHQAKPEELAELKTLLETKPRKKVIKKRPIKEIKEPKMWLNPRIP